MSDNIKAEIIVNERKINVLKIDNKEYISLTDLARYADEDIQGFLYKTGCETKM